MLHPDTEEMMCRISAKRMNWYLERNLAKKIDDKTIQLLFVPQGKGQTDNYFLQSFNNVCVVCGVPQNLNIHHIFPNCYRKYFSSRLRHQAAYDMVLLCDLHHHEYEEISWHVKVKLGKQYDVPMCGQGGKRNKEESKVYSVANALLKHENRIPAEKQIELYDIIKNYLNICYPTKTDFEQLIEEIDSRTKTGQTYGDMVAEKIENLHEFMVFWRKHFIETMKPSYMPTNWNINKCLVDYK